MIERHIIHERDRYFDHQHKTAGDRLVTAFRERMLGELHPDGLIAPEPDQRQAAAQKLLGKSGKVLRPWNAPLSDVIALTEGYDPGTLEFPPTDEDREKAALLSKDMADLIEPIDYTALRVSNAVFTTLNDAGVRTVGDLYATPPSKLKIPGTGKKKISDYLRGEHGLYRIQNDLGDPITRCVGLKGLSHRIQEVRKNQ